MSIFFNIEINIPTYGSIDRSHSGKISKNKYTRFTDNYTNSTNATIRGIIKELFPTSTIVIQFEQARQGWNSWQVKLASLQIVTEDNIMTKDGNISGKVLATFIRGGLLYKDHNYFLENYLKARFTEKYVYLCIETYQTLTKQKNTVIQTELDI